MTTTTVRVLQALLHDPGQELYGFELAELTDLAPGTIYPILARFQHLGWVASRWEDIDPRDEKRPARRYYRMTPDGMEQARTAIESAQRTKRSPRNLGTLPEST
ncbi:PadR family transcriptional regulator [Actinomadura macra]|uniref:PadR family transcriptional regulator n=1 Tax=Actinomadura macra TaxID=46164 RepID=UPI0008296FC9|nr:helix-turn-helix transcriptional regulator [Actinomadura macra]